MLLFIAYLEESVNSMSKNSKWIKIPKDIIILELQEKYPLAVEFLLNEYEFHCIGCVMASFETLEEGARAHGIEGKDFDKLLKQLEKIVNS